MIGNDAPPKAPPRVPSPLRTGEILMLFPERLALRTHSHSSVLLPSLGACSAQCRTRTRSSSLVPARHQAAWPCWDCRGPRSPWLCSCRLGPRLHRACVCTSALFLCACLGHVPSAGKKQACRCSRDDFIYLRKFNAKDKAEGDNPTKAALPDDERVRAQRHAKYAPRDGNDTEEFVRMASPSGSSSRISRAAQVSRNEHARKRFVKARVRHATRSSSRQSIQVLCRKRRKGGKAALI